MIDLYTFGTPNGRKVSIMLEEVRLPYTVHVVDIMKGAQNTPEFLKISPNGKIPAIRDAEGPEGRPFTLFESGAILIYLAEKTKSPLLAAEPETRYTTLAWLMWQMGGVGPMFGQSHHFRSTAPEKIPYAIERYSKEVARLFGVLDRRLAESAFLGGASYSIADIATYPWAARFEAQGIDLAGFPHVARWLEKVGERDAVQRGMCVPS